MFKEQKQRIYLGFIMVLVTFSSMVISLYFSYQAAFEEKRSDLINLAKSRARVIEAVARFDLEQSADFPNGHVEATLSQFREAHDKFDGFGKTGEYALAKLEGDQIVFLLKHRHSTPTQLSSIPLNSTFAEPMKRALKGKSGAMVGLDYRGELVLAAYEPVDVLNLGLVVKIVLAEVREPFIRAGVVAGLGGLLIIILGVFVFFRFSEPLIRSIQLLQQKYERAVQGSKDGLWDWPDVTRDEQWWSDEWYALLGYQKEDIKAKFSGFKSLLHPDDLPRMEAALKNHFNRKDEYEIEYRLMHKNGKFIWVRGRGTAQRDDKGKVIRMSGSISYIDDQIMNHRTIEKLSQVIQQIPISVLITDQEGKIEFINEALTRLSGYTRKEILGNNPRMFKSGESPNAYYRALWETLLKGKEWRGVFHNKKKNGELYWESVLIFPLKDINGKVTNFIGLKEDVTEKKQMESTLIDHERLIRSVVNNLNDGLIISNMDGCIQLFNKGAEQIFGYSAAEVMNHPVTILMDESYKEKHARGFGDFKKIKELSQKSKLLNVEAKKKDGTSVPIELTLTQMEQRGEILVIGLIRDISARRVAEKKSVESEQRLEQVLEAAEVYFWEWEIETDKVIFDPEWIKFLGYTQDEIEPTFQQCKDLVHPDDLPELYKALDNHVQGKSDVLEIEYRALKKSGEWIWTLDKGKILERDENGNPLRAFGTFFNIQNAKAAEEKMEQVQKQLAAAEKLAGVGELAAGVSHEVLNPVNIISVHTQMLQRKTKEDSTIQNYCEKVRHEIERIQKIMGSLLAFSRKSEIEFKEGNIRETIESVLALVEEEFKLDNIKIIREWCDTDVSISFDVDKIRQVYLNLIHNAKHAMPDGGTIAVGCKAVTGNGSDFHRFFFSDTGTGMSKEIKSKIFEPFFTTKAEGQGTGMGLAVIHGIIAEHGGKIRVESEEGKGTTFVITLPVASK